MNHRSDRVASLIQEELGKILQREFSISGALVTITTVIVEKKLEKAEIKVGVIPSSKDDEALRALQQSRGRLQFLLHRKLNIMPMPRIEFAIDHGAENAAKVEKILLQEDNKEA